MKTACRKIFITGNSRSGTTLMGKILNNHHSIFTFNELHFFEQIWSPEEAGKKINKQDAVNLFCRLLAIQHEGYLLYKNINKYKEESERYISELSPSSYTVLDIFSFFLSYEALKNKKNIGCDQTPRNVFYLKEILDNYPDAYIINMVRDCRDVLLSTKNKWKRKFLGSSQIPIKESIRSWVNYHPITISKLWNISVSSAMQLEGHPRLLNVKFEELINASEFEIKKICKFLDIDFELKMLHVPSRGSSNATDVKGAEGINSSVVGSWQKGGLNKTEIAICQNINKKELSKFHYVFEKTDYSILLRLFYNLTFPVKLGFAFLFNISRMKNISQAIMRRVKIN